MTNDDVTVAERLRLLDVLLAEPHAVLVAIAADGRLMPMPASVPAPAERVLQLPEERSTMLDFVVEDDVMPVVRAWHRAMSVGAAVETVRTRIDPLVGRALTFLDLRDPHGVLVGALGEQVDGETDQAPEVTVSRRPRTAVLSMNTLAEITTVDDRLCGMLGWAAEHSLGRNLLEFIHPDDQHRSVLSWIELVTHGIAQRVRIRHSRADGSWAWLELESTYQAADVAEDSVVVTQLNDVSEEMAAQEQLRQQEQLLRRVAESMPVGIAQLSAAGDLLYSNSRLQGVLGLVRVTGPADVLSVLSETDAAGVQAALDAATTQERDTTLEVRLARPGGQVRVCSVTVTPLSNREGAPGALLCVTDVTDSVRLREELTAKATFDVLTGCHNRASTMAVLDQALDADEGLTAAVFIDLDHFKPINDTFGHAVGDEVLAATAARLAGALRRDDVLGRIGGDEFLVIARRVGSPELALALAGRLRDALLEPIELACGPLVVGASIGVACAEPGVDAVQLTKRADVAMYECKQQRTGVPVAHAGG